MKILLTSDTHGHLSDISSTPSPADSYDLVCFIGDILPDFYDIATIRRPWDNLRDRRLKEGQEEWFWEEFVTYCSPFKQVVFVAGNHDIYFDTFSFKENLGDLPCNMYYLESSHRSYNGKIIYGSPWVSKLPGGWAFTGDEEQVYRSFARMPEKVDLLLSHGPPKEFCHFGSPGIDKVLMKHSVNILACGHDHENGGLDRVHNSKTRVINTAQRWTEIEL